MKILAEIAMYAVFIIVVGLLSAWPPYELVDEDRAVISLVFSHAGERISECRRMTQEELNKLPPNMRKADDCPRERHPVRVELRSGTELLYQETLLPSGIWADGKASIYQRIEVQSGVHELFVGMNHSGGEMAFDFVKSESVDVQPGRNLVIQFDEQARQFLIR
ncbi:MAG: hypothetical protein GY924_06970 [Planctomycetaceae bacterium]|nr:hypothetical protein [Planctomycetaceae bacterium]